MEDHPILPSMKENALGIAIPSMKALLPLLRKGEFLKSFATVSNYVSFFHNTC
jgi:hypothetical protein